MYIAPFSPIFPILTYRSLAVTKGQGQPGVIIFIKFVELESPMLHAKFQDHRTSGVGEEDFKAFTICGHGDLLSHVTWTILLAHLSRKAHKVSL